MLKLPKPRRRGTSPRMRGKRTLPVLRAKWHRNIPAYAGKTIIPYLGRVKNSEHPRVCGENCLLMRLFLSLGGTSPRMRGKLITLQLQPSQVRNIPAYAGKTG